MKAGFPSPAEDIREKFDLIKLLVKHKASTFFFRVSGVSMVDANMDKGVRLMPANEKNTDYKPIEVIVENDFLIRVGFFKFEEEDVKELTSSS